MNKGHLYNDKIKEKIDCESPRLLEYPRPNFKRDNYLMLNGVWDLNIQKTLQIPNEFNLKVNVPYALESPLSGVNKLIEPDDFMFYKRKFEYKKPQNNRRVIINFDGVDMFCDVFLNDTFVGYHAGGYTKFSFDITDYLKDGENILILKVNDLSDTSYHLRGKQLLNAKDYFYTTSSGIYKPVWIEEVPENHIKSVKFTPLVDEGKIKIKVDVVGEDELFIDFNEKTFRLKPNEDNLLDVENPHFWSDKDPYLYDVRLTFGEDVVKSYFGYRKIEVKKDASNQPGIYLNNKRIILNGLLDQGYYFLGNLTPGSYKDYEDEILNLKRLGFNTIRKHIKVECDMFYYYCDKYGMLLIQDFVNGGSTYKFLEVVLPRVFTPFINKESWIKEGMFGREDPNGMQEFEIESKEICDNLHNYPSIIVFTIFNEGWGEFEPSKMYKIFKKYDSSRLFDTASGWIDSEFSDFYSVHSYTIPCRKRYDKIYNRPYVLTETGGRGLKVKDHSYFDGFFSHGKSRTQKSYSTRFFRLYKKLLKQLESGTLSGIINTEVADCESEYNGIYTFDRKVLKLDEKKIIEINKKIADIYK